MIINIIIDAASSEDGAIEDSVEETTQVTHDEIIEDIRWGEIFTGA